MSLSNPHQFLLRAPRRNPAARALFEIAECAQLDLQFEACDDGVTLQTRAGSLNGLIASARFLAGARRDAALLGCSHYESSLIDQWLWWASNELDAQSVAPLSHLEKHLRSRTFLVGERFSLADIVVSSTLHHFQSSEALAALPSIDRWLTTCAHQPAHLIH